MSVELPYNYMNNLELIFKRLLWLEVAVVVFYLFVGFGEITFGLDETLVEWQIYLADQYIIGYLFALIFLIAYIVSLPLLFFYKKLGRTLFLWTHILSVPFYLFLGPQVMDPVSAAVDYLGALNGGVIIAMMYFSDISKKFLQNKVTYAGSKNISSELERINKLREEGSISEEEFKAAKEKLLNQ